MATNDNMTIIKMLLENLTASLTQMVIKYESISRNCDLIEEKTESLSKQTHDVTEIKEIVSSIREYCLQNQQTLSTLLTAISETKDDINELFTNTTTHHSQHTEKINTVLANLASLLDSTSRGFIGMETKMKDVDEKLEDAKVKIEDTRAKIAPLSRAAKLISTPLGLALFIFGFMAAVFLVGETIKGAIGMVKEKPATEIHQGDTNYTHGANSGK